MNDCERKNKALWLSLGLVLVLGLMIPTTAHAQYGGGALGYGPVAKQQSREGLFANGFYPGGYFLYNQQFGDIQYGGYNLYNQTFGQELPLGSGLGILTAAAVGYALKKRKNNGKNQKS